MQSLLSCWLYFNCLKCIFLTPEGKKQEYVIWQCTLNTGVSWLGVCICVTHTCTDASLDYGHTSTTVLCKHLETAKTLRLFTWGIWGLLVQSSLLNVRVRILFYAWTSNVCFPCHQLLLFKTGSRNNVVNLLLLSAWLELTIVWKGCSEMVFRCFAENRQNVLFLASLLRIIQ